jgi:hypothetical protein
MNHYTKEFLEDFLALLCLLVILFSLMLTAWVMTGPNLSSDPTAVIPPAEEVAR